MTFDVDASRHSPDLIYLVSNEAMPYFHSGSSETGLKVSYPPRVSASRRGSASGYSSKVHSWLLATMSLAGAAVISTLADVLFGAPAAKTIASVLILFAIVCGVFWLERADSEQKQRRAGAR